MRIYLAFGGIRIKRRAQYFEKQMYEIIDRDINHPSVIYWVLFNETWGLKTYKGEVNPSSKDWEYTKETQEWVRKLWNDVKRYDSTRLVEDNSPCNRDHVETDVNTWHFYINGYDRIKKECERIDREFVEGSKWKITFVII